jgi:cell division protein FtsB
MSAVTQQINLYQPVADSGGTVPFSFNTALLLVSCVAVGLMAVWGYGLWRVQSLERAVSQLRQQQEHQTQTLANLTAARATGTSPEQLEARVRLLSTQLAAHSRALALVRNGGIGGTAGFSASLAALARHPVAGLWITHVVLAGVGESQLSLAGVAQEPRLVPRYLQALATEPALAGLRFNDFTIARPSQKAASATDSSQSHELPKDSQHGFVFQAQSGTALAHEGDHRS